MKRIELARIYLNARQEFGKFLSETDSSTPLWGMVDKFICQLCTHVIDNTYLIDVDGNVCCLPRGEETSPELVHYAIMISHLLELVKTLE